MLGGSTASLAICSQELDRVIGADAALASDLSVALAALLDALAASPALLRAIANPNRQAGDRQNLARQLMTSQERPVADFVAFVVGQRWSRDADLASAVEHLSFEGALANAELLGLLEQLEAGLFQIDNTLTNHRELRTALAEAAAPASAKVDLLEAVFGQQMDRLTVDLVSRLVAQPRGRGLRYSLHYLSDLVAKRRQRLVASVTCARPLSQTQQTKLTALLTEQYGQAIQLNVVIEPNLVGGLRIRVGDEVVDGTILARFKDLKRAIAA